MTSITDFENQSVSVDDEDRAKSESSIHKVSTTMAGAARSSEETPACGISDSRMISQEVLGGGDDEDVSTLHANQNKKVMKSGNQASTDHPSILQWDRHAFVSALRLSIGLFLASLFVLVPIPTEKFGTYYPEGIWVFITVAVTMWQPEMDSAEVFQKCSLRLIGTLYSSAIGMLVGYLSLCIERASDETMQQIFMGIAIIVYSFVHGYVVASLKMSTSYAIMLGNFTFGLSMFGFLDPADPWLTGTFRVVNIVIGIVITLLVTLTVFPTSTKEMITRKLQNHLALTGLSVDKVLGEAEALLLHDQPPIGLMEKIASGKQDSVHSSYLKSVEDWARFRSLMPLLQKGPVVNQYWVCNRSIAKDNEDFQKSQLQTVARCFRIQVNAISIDAMCRADSGIAMGHPLILSNIRNQIRQIFDTTLSKKERHQAVQELLKEDLVQLRNDINTSFLQQQQQYPYNNGNSHEVDEILFTLTRATNQPFPFQHTTSAGTSGQSLLFMQLLEHLILRVARLYFFCLNESTLQSTLDE